MNKKIVLLGYMGSGKSTIGKILASKLQIPFYDLDEYIENKQQKSIKSIFETKGEIFFRKIEHQYLNELLNNDEEIVISLGGGTPCYANNYLHFKKNNVLSFYLKTSIKTLANRLKSETSQRPLLNSTEENLETFIAKHLFDRSFFYNKAKYKITTDNKKPTELLDELINYI